MRNGFLVAACAFFTCLAVVRPSHAQDSAAAEALFRSAREAAELGDWVTACDRFEESKRLEPAPGTVLNLARCRENLGQVASAWKSYTEAVQRLPSRDERHAFARKKAMELEERIPHLILNPPDTTAKMVVTIDGTELSSATFGVPLPFDPGEIEIIVQAAGYEKNATQLVLTEGDDVTHQLELGEAANADPVSEAALRESPSATGSAKNGSLPFFLLGGLGVAVAAGGGIWAGVELPKVKDKENCVNGSCTDVGANAAARGRIAVYLVGAGTVLAAGGLSIGAYLRGKKKESQVVLAPLPGGGALFWRADL